MKQITSQLLLPFVIFLLLTGCKKSNESAPPAPLAYYKFDNDYLHNAMSSLLGGNMIGNGTSTNDSLNTPYACLSINGDGMVEVKDSDLLDFIGNQFTLSIWIRPTKTSVTYLIAKNGDANVNTPYTLDIHPGKVRAFVTTNTDEHFSVEGTTLIKAGYWQHIAATFSGTKLTIYYNGKKEGSVDVDRPLAISKGNLGIGGHAKYYPGTSLQGRMDNVKIFDKALTDAQVNALYKNYKD